LLISFGSNTEFGQFVPLVFIDRDGSFQQSQLTSYFSFLSNKSSIAVFVTILSTGVLLLFVGAFLLFKSFSLAKIQT
jgi:hypothetical protein